MSYYAVANGKNIGIYLNWNDCKEQIDGFKNCRFKKFNTKEDAKKFIKEYNDSKTIVKEDLKNNSIFKKEIVKNKVLNHDIINKEQSNINITKSETIEFNPDYYVYTDGACLNNGNDDAIAGIGIFFGVNDAKNVSKKINGKQTNNTAELSAIIETYNIIKDDILNGKKVMIVSDSKYAMLCVTSYGEKNDKKGWIKDIPNKELVKTGYNIYKNILGVRFMYVKAHTNNLDVHSIGNNFADKLANDSVGIISEDKNNNEINKIYLNVPFLRKDEVLNLGGKWDYERQKWYIVDSCKKMDEILKLFEKYV